MTYVATDGSRSNVWVSKTRPGMLSRRFARPDRIRRDGCLLRRSRWSPSNERIVKATNTAKRFYCEAVRSPVRPSCRRDRCSNAASDGTITVDRAVPVMHRARAPLGQIRRSRGLDEFSEPTRSLHRTSFSAHTRSPNTRTSFRHPKVRLAAPRRPRVSVSFRDG